MSLSLPAIVLMSAAGAAEVDVYGRLNVTPQNSDEAAEEQVELQSNASRVGVKGEEALQGGPKVIYQFEWGVDFDDQSGDENLSARNRVASGPTCKRSRNRPRASMK